MVCPAVDENVVVVDVDDDDDDDDDVDDVFTCEHHQISR